MAIAPTSEPNATPLNHLGLNQDWAGVLIGLCEQYALQESYWQGSPTDIQTAIENVHDLIWLLMTNTPPTEGGQLSIGAILPFFGELPANMLLCDNSQYSQATYPDLYNALPDELRIDESNFRTPPTPQWNALLNPTATASAGTASAAIDGSPATWVGGTSMPQWLQLTFSNHVRLTGYTMQSDNTGYLKDFKLQALLHGEWVDIDNQTGLTWSAFETKSFSLATPAIAASFRVWITAMVTVGQAPRIREMTIDRRNAWQYGVVYSE